MSHRCSCPRTRCVLYHKPNPAQPSSLAGVLPEFIHSLQKRNWKVDTNLDHDHLHDVLPPSTPSIADPPKTTSEPNEAGEEEADSISNHEGPAPFPGGLSPRTLWGLKRVLITKTSHIGGHKYSGNVIVSSTNFPNFIFPTCTSSWLGRVFLPLCGGKETPSVCLSLGVTRERLPPQSSARSPSPSPPNRICTFSVSSIRRPRTRTSFTYHFSPSLSPFILSIPFRNSNNSHDLTHGV